MEVKERKIFFFWKKKKGAETECETVDEVNQNEWRVARRKGHDTHWTRAESWLPARGALLELKGKNSEGDKAEMPLEETEIEQKWTISKCLSLALNQTWS